MPDPARAPSSTVHLSFQPRPVHVRTARLVAVTVARRAGWDEEQVESVRQAVGEACALALRAAGAEGTVSLELDDSVAGPGGGAGLRAWVWPVALAAGPGAAVEHSDPADADALPRAVLAGLTDELSVDDRHGQPALRLSWWR